jgi:hypothetical protein
MFLVMSPFLNNKMTEKSDHNLWIFVSISQIFTSIEKT